MPKYIISSEGSDPITLDCPGCSGDALELALVPRAMQVVQRFYSLGGCACYYWDKPPYS